MQRLLHALMPCGVREQKRLVAQFGVVGDEETTVVQQKAVVEALWRRQLTGLQSPA